MHVILADIRPRTSLCSKPVNRIWSCWRLILLCSEQATANRAVDGMIMDRKDTDGLLVTGGVDRFLIAACLPRARPTPSRQPGFDE